jgi:RNA polymerase sigma-70 factor, ECF subfamily
MDKVAQEPADLPFEEDKDALLMVRAAEGDLGAFEELVIRSQSAAWRLAVYYLGNAAEAEDIVQEAFLKLLQAAPRYRPTARFRTYFSQIVVRLCLDYRRKKQPYYREVLPDGASTARDPEAVLRDEETATKLRLALGDLPPTQRIALLLCYLEGFTYSEIAETMSTSAKAVDSLLQRARHTLRVSLDSIKDRFYR